ncbi:MAG: DUF3782 domain-containing protein [Vulcanisaeta sp.]|nr:DUF3782 domain-containing protein [Vulcanisaeta sp.]MCG2869151.1 DUF3782 domain-containing protein [Vulcanisaeta sp.]
MGVDLRKELLRLLKEDEEFRLAVTGLLGIDEILKAIKSLQEQMVKLQEQVAKQGEAILALQRSFEKLTASITALGYRYGIYTEDVFRDAIKYLVEDLLKAYEVRRWTYYDNEGVVFGYPSIIDVDVLIRDNEHILIEYKASIDRGDVAELAREGILYERVNKIKPKLLIVGPVVRRRALELAKALNIEVRAIEVMD